MNHHGAGFSVFMAVFALYLLYSIYRIARKTNTAHAWLAWIPVVNFFLLLKIAGKPAWWFVLILVPFVNLVIVVMVWMRISKTLHKPGWLGLLMLVPIANLVLPGYLAFSEGPAVGNQADRSGPISGLRDCD